MITLASGDLYLLPLLLIISKCVMSQPVEMPHNEKDTNWLCYRTEYYHKRFYDIDPKEPIWSNLFRSIYSLGCKQVHTRALFFCSQSEWQILFSQTYS